MSLRKDLHQLLDKLIRQGHQVENTPGGHIKIRLKGGGLVFAASSPSDIRSIRNIRAELRKRGVQT